MNTAAPCFTRGVLCKDWSPWLFQNVFTPLVQETLFPSSEDTGGKQADVWFQLKGSPRRCDWDEEQKHKPQTFVCECHYMYVRLCEVIRMPTVSQSRTSSTTRCIKSAPVWLTESSKDPLQALLKRSGSHLNHTFIDSLSFCLAKHWLQQLVASSLMWTGASVSEEAAELKQALISSNPNWPKRCLNATFTWTHDT